MRFQFDQLCQLFGRPVEDAAVQRLLSSMPPHTLDKPSDGAQYLICKPGGIDLLFKDEVNRGSGKKQSRLLKAFYVYNEDADEHCRCDIALPFEFLLSDSRDDLIAIAPRVGAQAIRLVHRHGVIVAFDPPAGPRTRGHEPDKHRTGR